MKNILIVPGDFHHMNKKAFDEILFYLKWNKVNSIDEADIIYSPSSYLDTERFPNKKFIFGPHFSVFPNENARKISNKHNNAVYIQPSQPSIDTWVHEFSFNNVPMKPFPFPLNLDDYPISKEKKDDVLLYCKHRDPNEIEFVKNFFESKNIKYIPIVYGSYIEKDFQKQLNKSKYAICIGAHESQGFAIQSIMCKNIPLLVWGVTLRKQEYPYKLEYQNVKSKVSTVPYWDDMCGELFFKHDELENKHSKLINNLKNYTPRKFIEKNLTVKQCANNLLKLI